MEVTDELVRALTDVVAAGFEVCHESGKNVRRHGADYVVQESWRGCTDFADPEDAVRDFLSGLD